MGNIIINKQKMNSCLSKNFCSVDDFQFHDLLPEDGLNGLIFNNIVVPEEVVATILSYVDPKELLHLTLVCRKWCNIIKSDVFWKNVYKRYSNDDPKKLPWYVYYCFLTTDNFVNLIKNGNGQDNFNHWSIIKNYGDEFKIENPPVGADPLPPSVPEFNGHTSCFVTSFYECLKIQIISLENKRLLRYIIRQFRPHIKISEWTAGRFDCGCVYKLRCRLYRYKSDIDDPEFATEQPLNEISLDEIVEQWQGHSWKKVEATLKDYSTDVKYIVFGHEGHDTQFWKGHYGSKMAGGVVKFLINSINVQS